MNLRIKFLTFLGIFLLGSFLIITWKSFSIFSQKYATAMGQAEMQKLEVQAQSMAQRFQSFQIALSENKNIEAQLKGMGVQLLAHVINEQGKWKAQWFEGQSGARQAAHTATQQIPFESLSTTRKSWHAVNVKELQSHLAYVIPSSSKQSVGFFVFFLANDFFQRQFQWHSQNETTELVSPYLGEVFSTGSAGTENIERYKKAMMDQQSGVIPVSQGRSMIFIFNPDLQLYLVKTKKLAELTVDKPIYLATLAGIMALLIAAALFAQDLLLKSVMVESLTVTEVEPDSSAVAAAEAALAETEKTPEPVLPHPPVAPQMEELLMRLRPRAINSMGYLHKIKQSLPTSPHVVLLEAELRELRRTIDPVEGTVKDVLLAKAQPPQPAFNPFLKESFIKDDAEIAKTEVASTAAEARTDDNAVVIRKPKREANDSGKL